MHIRLEHNYDTSTRLHAREVRLMIAFVRGGRMPVSLISMQRRFHFTSYLKFTWSSSKNLYYPFSALRLSCSNKNWCNSPMLYIYI